MEKRRLRVTDGGYAVPLGNNYFLMKGKTHEQGGIGLSDKVEVENNEIVKVNKDSAKVYSAQPMIAGYSPAELILSGANPRKVFSIQQSLNGNNNNGYAKDGTKTNYGIMRTVTDFIRNLFSNDNSDNNKSKEEVKPLPSIDISGVVIDPDELRIKQAYTESGFSSNKVSSAGARGMYQIMSDVLTDYNRDNKTNFTIEDLSNDSINTVIRDYKFNKTLNSNWVNKNNPNEVVRYAKTLSGYNYGNTNTIRALEKAKKDGVDIYNTIDWVNTKYLPQENVDYVLYQLGLGGNSVHRNEVSYNASKIKNKDKIDAIKRYKYGGIMNKKNNNNNEFHLVKDTFNMMIPSTGERKKFLTGGEMLGINAGLQGLNAIVQGSIGSANAKKLEEMYNKLTRKSTYVPIARRHINTNYDVSPMLDSNRDAEFTLAKNAMANTSSSKVAREQLKQARLARMSADNTAYATKINEENKLQQAETELQKQYDMYDNQSLTKDISDKNDFEMQKQLGITNAKTNAANAWGKSVGNALSGIGDTLLKYTISNNELMASNGKDANAQGFINQYGRYYKINDNGELVVRGLYKNNARANALLEQAKMWYNQLGYGVK